MIATTTAPAPKTRAPRLPGRPAPPPRKQAKPPDTPPENAPEAAEEAAEQELGAVEPETAAAAIGDPGTPADLAGLWPLPKLPTHRKGGKFSTAEFSNLAKFWNDLSPEQRQHSTLYVYRNWPVLIPEEVERKSGVQFQNPFSLKIIAEDGPLSLDLIRSKRGFGDYYCRLNQCIHRPHGTVLVADFKIPCTWEDFETWPVLDTEKIDLADPSNEEYIRRMKLRGILKAPPDPDKQAQQQGEDDMSAHTAALTNSVEKLTDRVIDMAREKANPGAAAAGDTVNGELVGLLRDQIEKGRPPQEQGSLIETLTGITNLAKSIVPAPAPPPDLTPLVSALQETNKTVQAMQAAQLQRAEQAAIDARQATEAARAQIPKPLTLSEQLAELDKVEAIRKRLRGGSGRDRDEDEDGDKPAPAGGFLGALAPVLESLKTIFILGTNAYYNYTLQKVGKAVNPASGEESNQPLAPDISQTLNPEQQAEMKQMQEYFDQLRRIEPYLLNYLQKGKTGAQFAQFVIDASDVLTLQNLQGAGKENLLQIIQQYPPIWDQVKGIQPRFDRFLDEFLTYKPADVAIN